MHSATKYFAGHSCVYLNPLRIVVEAHVCYSTATRLLERFLCELKLNGPNSGTIERTLARRQALSKHGSFCAR